MALGLGPTTRVVLTGWSRGAAFSVLVGSERLSQDDILGVIAIGLAEGEDLAINDAADDTDNSSGSRQRQWPFETYALISRLDALPCAVIQASHDVYLPAARARQLFGPDTPLRRLYAIEASNHRFSGGKAAFDMALLDALHWIAASARVAADPMPATTPIGESSMRATRVSANGAWGRVRPASSTDVPVAVDAPLLRCCERHRFQESDMASHDNLVQTKVPAFGLALTAVRALYLDFVNLFLSLLRLVGRRRD